MSQQAEKIVPIGKQRIQKRLEQFQLLIDMSDWDGRPTDQIKAAFFSRALAAYFVQLLADVPPDIAAKSVTDSFHDRGIDAIHYDAKASRLLIVQAKWSDALGWKDAGEYCDGVRKVIEHEWVKFSNNPRIHGRQQEIDTVLFSGACILLATVCVGPRQKADLSALKRVDDLAQEIDGGSGSDIAKSLHWNQKELLDEIKRESEPEKINADLYLSEWGEVQEPYRAVYGRVQAQAIVDLWQAHPHLSHSNLRRYFNRTDVNNAIAKTVQDEPEHFWYLNNGLTIICDSFRPGISGRLKKDEGVYHFSGVNIVNGAQTTGILSDYLETIPVSERDKLWIQIRAIELRDCPVGFATKITKSTNLQNAVTAQDFAALDPVQPRLACDFAVEKRTYVFKWGEPDPAIGCTLKEATYALACANSDPWFTLQVKREISLLWDTDSPQYRQLFHDNLTATRVWNAVNIMREVDATVGSLGKTSPFAKAEAVASHMQRIVLHLVFQSTALNGWDIATDARTVANTAGEVSHEVFRKVHDYVQENHASEYMAALSKNFEKCREMVRRLLAGDVDPYLPFAPAKNSRRRR